MTQQYQGTGADSAPQLTGDIPVSHGRQYSKPTPAPRPQNTDTNVRPSEHSEQEGSLEPRDATELQPQGVMYELKRMLSRSFRASDDERIASAKAAEEARIAQENMRVEEEQQRQINLKEQQRMDRILYRDCLRESIWRNGQQQTFTVTISQVKGGVGKTTTTCYVASTLGFATTRLTTVIDNNEMWGTSGRLLGIPQNATLTVRSAHAKKEQGDFQDFRSFSGMLGSTIHSVQLVAADALMQRDDLYGYETAKEVIELVQNNSIFVVNDTGNHIAGQAMKAALENTNVLVIPTITSGNSLEGARVTMQNYRDWGYPELVDHAIVVVSGLQPGETAEDYRSKMDLSENQILLGIPYDDRIRQDYVVAIKDTPILTTIAYLELTLTAMMVHKHIAQHGLESAPLKVTQGEVVALSSGRKPVLPYARK